MCRWFAYISTEPILLDDCLIRPVNAVTKQIVAYWEEGQFVNADGFGITWYTESRSHFNPLGHIPSPEEQRRKQPLERPIWGQVGDKNRLTIGDGPLLPFVMGPRPAMFKTTNAKPLNDPSFISICANVSSKCLFAHLRAADNPPIAITNNHPFVFGRQCFQHNGIISDFSEIRKEMLTHISEGLSAMIEGGTDTEHLAAIVYTNLCKPADYSGADKHYQAADIWKALVAAIKTVEDIQRKRFGVAPDNILNISATDGDSLVALCYRTEKAAVKLWASVDAADVLNRKPYASGTGTIFEETQASSPDAIKTKTLNLIQKARPAVVRDANKKVTGLDPDLVKAADQECRPLPNMHGPHVIVASEATTLSKGWFTLNGGDALLVDIIQKGDRQVLDIKPASFY